MKLADQSGVDAFLTKPVSPSTMLDTLLGVLGREQVFRETPAGDTLQQPLPGFAGARILLVEDNEINREVATELLHSLQLQVDEAINGEEAVAMVQQHHYDCVLMDIQMPVMDGLEAARQIRALAQRPDGERFATLPIIAMTAMAMEQDAERCRAAGMNAHVSKPIDPNVLSGTLSTWIGQQPGSRSRVPGAAPSRSRPAALPENLLALQSLNVPDGLRRIGGRLEPYLKQLRRFREHYPNSVSELQRILHEQGPKAAEAYCHALKGVSGNIGAEALFGSLSALDRELKQGIVPTPASFETLQQRLLQLLHDIEQAIAVSPPVVEQSRSLSTDEIRARIDRLRLALHMDFGAVENLVLELNQGLFGTPLQADMESISRKIDNFELETAIAELDALHARLPLTDA